MANNAQGLPIEYFKYPEFFDDHNVFSDTEATNQALEMLLREYKVRRVLDMTCGTGSQVFFLAEKGYEITGSDFSEPLINIARKKAKERNLKIEFIVGDMRSLKCGLFDAVITIFNSIGHLTKPEFNLTLRNIKNNLKDGGIYIFDIINPKILTKEILEQGFERQVLNEKITNLQKYKFNSRTNIINCYEDVRVMKAPNDITKLKNKFSLQLYQAEELQHILEANGFKCLKQCDAMGEEFTENYSLNIVTVARKAF